MPTRLLNNQRGVSVLAVIFVIVVLTAIGYTFSAMMAAKQRSVPVTLTAGKAFYISEGGIYHAGKYLSDQADWNSLSGTTPAELTNVILGGGSFTVSLSGYSSGGGEERITATSTSTYEDGHRELSMTFERDL